MRREGKGTQFLCDREKERSQMLERILASGEGGEGPHTFINKSGKCVRYVWRTIMASLAIRVGGRQKGNCRK